MRFLNRADAGRHLGRKLAEYRGRTDVLVFGLPRGGVPVAAEVARALGAPLHVFTVRKLGVPGHEELAFGAVASGGARVLNRDVVEALGIPPEEIERVTVAARRALEERDRALGTSGPRPEVAGRVVILIDDGLATGASMRVAAQALRAMGPARLVVGVPVAPAEVCHELGRAADEVVCVLTPDPFFAVGIWYDDFDPTSDDEVRRLLEPAAAGADAAPNPRESSWP